MTVNDRNELPWLAEAIKYIGQREVKGGKNNPLILSWLQNLKAWWANDETPWCGVFVANALKNTGRCIPTHWYRAIDYLNCGTSLTRPAYGCIVIFTREGGGHVGFVVGQDKKGNLMVLGGNQGDAVNIKPFSVSRVSGYRWPSDVHGKLLMPHPSRFSLPLVDSNESLSNNEQ